ncbi:synaptopodin [Pseudophryne corroboree]|uniref:synaptopodin n=1 Tax=Pseudophryne corroboree TaxID=495146 RepID=UPI003081E0EA
MMLKSSPFSQSTLGGSILVRGLPHEYMAQNAGVGHESWNTTSDKYLRVENSNDESPNENNGDEISEIRTAHWAIVEEEPDEPINGFTNDGDATAEEGTRLAEESLKLDPIPIKTEQNNLEWKIERSTNVVSAVQQPRKTYFPRSLSLTEKELREAQSLSDDNAAQLSPSGRCSRGAQLFHRRRQKLKAFEEQKLARLSAAQHTDETQNKQVQHGVIPSNCTNTEFQFGHRRPPRFHSMDETSTDPGNAAETDDSWADDVRETDFPPIDKRAPSPSASEEDHQSPLSAYLKETLMVSNSNTNGLVIQTSPKSEPPVQKEQNGTQSTQYCEVQLTLSKPKSVSNRTAKPFGGQLSAKRNVSYSENSPAVELPPPPTYAETLSSPPPVTRVQSPPTYSTLYPTESAPTTPLHPVINHEEAKVTLQPKTGILDSTGVRRGPKKSMFTFIEKPKLAPNPELLSMVQNADEKRKQKEHGDIATEDEPFALGAEASNFQNNKPSNAVNNADQADKIVGWTSSLKSPGVTAKPPSMPIQTLSEDKGKGAQLFARRQSRMERYVVESPTPSDSARSPSPTMSLPPSWKFVANAKSPPSLFNHQSNRNQSSPKSPYNAPVNNTASEHMQQKKELEISRRQPYQLQSSLFILSPARDPVSSLPRAAPPPKPMVLESHRFTRQSSCPTSPLVPSPTIYSPSYSQSIRSPSYTMSPPQAFNTPPTFGRRTPTSQVSPVSPVPFSNTKVTSPRDKTVVQAPRPTFSARNSGLESQKNREFVPATSNYRTLQHQGSLDGWGSSSVSSPGYDEGPVIQSPPPRSMSPAWSERSQSPSPFRMEVESKAGKQMKALIARNIINAAKRKSTSPWGVTSPQSPVHINTPWSPTVRNGSSLPATPRGRRSPTGSDISLESEDSGAKSPGFRSYPFSPRGWYGSMRLKRDSLPSSSPFTYTP